MCANQAVIIVIILRDIKWGDFFYRRARKILEQKIYVYNAIVMKLKNLVWKWCALSMVFMRTKAETMCYT